jgi:hypothetical protein
VTPILEVTDSPHHLFQFAAFRVLLAATARRRRAATFAKTADLLAGFVDLAVDFRARRAAPAAARRQARLGLSGDLQTRTIT